MLEDFAFALTGGEENIAEGVVLTYNLGFGLGILKGIVDEV
jgi:hypothetical protein